MRSPAVAALLLVLGAVVGAGITLFLLPGAPPAPPALPAPPPAAVIPVAAEEQKPAAPGPGAPPVPRPAGAASLDDLGVHAEEWTFLRGALVRERERREAGHMGPALGGLEVMRRVKEFGLDPLSVLESYDAVRARVRVAGSRRPIEAPADASPVNLAEAAGDAAIVEFGPGTFVLDRRSEICLRVREGVRSLEIRGAGMDRTFLTGSSGDLIHVGEDAAFDNLIVGDLTLDGANGGLLLDVRGRASAALENVRVRGWQNGGHSAAIGVSGEALFGARGCEFLGGANGGLFVLSVRGPSLAVFEKCLFADVSEAVVGPGGSGEAGSAVRLLDCTYENCAVASRRMQRGKGKTAFPIAVRGGTVTLGPDDLGDEVRRELWGAPWLSSLEGVAFGPGKPDCTLGELLAVLDRVSVAPSEAVYGVRYLGPIGEGPTRFGIRILDRATSAVVWRVVGNDGTDLEKAPWNPGGGWNAPKAAALERIGLASAIRSSEIPAAAAAGEAALTGFGDGSTLHLYVRASEIGWPMWVADAATGKLQSRNPARR